MSKQAKVDRRKFLTGVAVAGAAPGEVVLIGGGGAYFFFRCGSQSTRRHGRPSGTDALSHFDTYLSGCRVGPALTAVRTITWRR